MFLCGCHPLPLKYLFGESRTVQITEIGNTGGPDVASETPRGRKNVLGNLNQLKLRARHTKARQLTRCYRGWGLAELGDQALNTGPDPEALSVGPLLSFASFLDKKQRKMERIKGKLLTRHSSIFFKCTTSLITSSSTNVSL